MPSRRAFTLYAAALLPCARLAQADTGPILIGASLPLSGTNAAVGNEGLAVLQAYCDSVNRNGGVDGRPLQLTALDDAFVPAKAAENARTLAAGKAVALVNCWGTASCSAMVPVVTQTGLPLVGGIAGGGAMRAAPARQVFNIRASTAAEIGAMVRHMTSIGQQRIAVVYQDDAFGKGGLEVAQQVLRERGLQPVLQQALAADGANAAAVAQALAREPAPNGIILLASPPATVALIPQARKAGLRAQFYNLAAQASDSVVQGLGEHTTGVVFTTLVPSPWRTSVPAVRDYQQLLTAMDRPPRPSYLGLEVYLNARVLVDGLRKAGRTVQRESLIQALESMETRQYGAMAVRFGPQQQHEGSSYVGLAMIDRRGQFIE
ncbi:amino acid/amide ABC transporter substrate-binding protein, HAAT family [Oryzisolibacter propanilivorax]|uniref:Amino acid/amide ABC transporter substrate-binding protein, HAAT family n=1 Tax=Oryzisolibacter propanilivorax TaxID=1527607 RepID=A0A1G9SBU9_9BURK|nr:ABC transporter substrate-binding protein [Oryzisolibacter propanilivorax]SDM32851.1 amino acid/amide ABC transporter substrate-binding protein, HAAT family [Oryzisolibacter propanilivorax]